MRRLGISAVAFFVATTCAFSQWHTNKLGGDFDDNPLYIAVIANLSGSHAFGLRCQGDEVEAVFMTSDKSFKDGDLVLVNATRPKLRVKVDKGEIHTLDAEISNTDKGARAVAEIDLALFNEIKGAKGTISAVLTLLDENYHETRFAAKGSTAALNKLVKGCGLADDVKK